MDYALMAATALGAIGLYMMLPRERPPLARLGKLISALALGGLFLYLVSSVGRSVGVGAGGQTPPVYFYLFAAIMIAGAAGVVCQPRPVYAALYFVLVTLAGAGIFVLLMAEFMAIVLVIIYAGAILVTYVFVIMLASQGSTGGVGGVAAPEYDRRANEPFVAVAVSFVLMGTVLQVLFPGNAAGGVLAEASKQPDVLMMANLGMTAPAAPGSAAPSASAPAAGAVSSAPASAPAEPLAAAMTPSNVQVVGENLYSHYAFSLELAGILLTIALVGAVVIARKNTGGMHDVLGSGKVPTE